MNAPSVLAGARTLIDRLVETDSWSCWDAAPCHSTQDPAYLRQLQAARDGSGCDEAVITGTAAIGTHRVALIVSEMRFLGGSIGEATADRIVVAIRRATALGIPVVALTASGGTRMQEGTPAFLRMVDITRAVLDHRASGLAYLVHLRHPTTGGVYASWGSAGQRTTAEPDALVGFLGPVVYEALHGTPFPPGVQQAENLLAHGIIDEVLDLADLRRRIVATLDVLARRRLPAVPSSPSSPLGLRRPLRSLPGDRDPWQIVLDTRHECRPGLRELLALSTDEPVHFTGTQSGERSAAVTVALATFGTTPCVVVGQDRRAQRDGHLVDPAALRTARRGIRLANEFALPLVTVVDTPGAELSPDAEERAIAPEISRCIADLLGARVPSVSVLLGEGCGGGALALLPADRVVAAENSWLAPLAPEGASAILHRTTEHAAQMARRQRITVADLAAEGWVDAVIPEVRPAHVDPASFCAAAVRLVEREIRATASAST